MNEISSVQAETSESMRQKFLDFSGTFSAEVKQTLMIFYDQIVNREVIPYKIKNKDWEVMVASSNAFSLKLTFHNVII